MCLRSMGEIAALISAARFATHEGQLWAGRAAPDAKASGQKGSKAVIGRSHWHYYGGLTAVLVNAPGALLTNRPRRQLRVGSYWRLVWDKRSPGSAAYQLRPDPLYGAAADAEHLGGLQDTTASCKSCLNYRLYLRADLWPSQPHTSSSCPGEASIDAG